MELEKSLTFEGTEEIRQKTVKLNKSTQKAMLDVQESLNEIYQLCFKDIICCRQLVYLHKKINCCLETFLTPKRYNLLVGKK